MTWAIVQSNGHLLSAIGGVPTRRWAATPRVTVGYLHAASKDENAGKSRLAQQPDTGSSDRGSGRLTTLGLSTASGKQAGHPAVLRHNPGPD